MHTIPELVRLVEQRYRVCVSERQIKEWHQDGLLPTPVRTPVSKKPGRAPYRFPESALETIAWLGTWRRYCNSPDITKFWMWMEGFPHISLDGGTWTRLVGERLDALHTISRRTFPHQDRDPATVSDAEREDIYATIDERVNQPLKDAGASKAMQQAYSFIAMVMTGLVDDDMALVLEQQAQADQNDGDDSLPYLDAIAYAAIEAAGPPHVDMQALPSEEPLPPITTLFPALTLPKLMTSGIDWTMLQQAWRLVITTPGLPAEFVHAVRRRVYGSDPTLVVAAMMSVCAVLPPETLTRTWRPLLRGTKRGPVPDKESAH